MTWDSIGCGSAPNDGTGDTLRAAGLKLNANFSTICDAIDALDAEKQDCLVPFTVTSPVPAAVDTTLSTGVVLTLLSAVAPQFNTTNQRVNEIAAAVNALRTLVIEWLAKSVTQGVQS